MKKHGRVLNVEGLLKPDLMGVKIAEKWMSWNMARQTKVRDWDEVRRYVYATDTRTTTNSSLPWKNTTTVPKLCQIRDNLHANYMAALFPKRKWLFWHADNPDDNALEKKKAIEEYMSYVIDRPEFKQEVSKMIYDYLDYGNIFATVSWQDDRVEQEKGSTQTGYVGPVPMRISPLDILFNPTAESVWKSPKIVKTIMTIGDLKHYMESLSSEENKEVLNDLFNYLKNSRQNSHQYGGDLHEKDGYLRVDGFDSYRHYLESDYVELLSFYGDMYDVENDKLYSNHIITIADRHKVISIQPNPSYFGNAPIFHAGWRVRQDNLWAMGPLDNLVGMQYRIDHIENLKADIFDLTAFPPIKIKGLVEDFTWGPFEKIYVGDDGDVELMGPDVSILQANMEIDRIELKMEEMAGAPREAMGFRTPGEKTAYEVQRTENAYSRIFQSKIQQFEEQILEPMLNAMLELARRKVDPTQVRTFNRDYNVTLFLSVTAEDLTGSGRIRPLAARHFAEKAEFVQNMNNFFSSPVGQDPGVRVHFSGLKMAQVTEEMLDVEDYKIVAPYVALTEQQEQQRLMRAQEEQAMMEIDQPSNLSPDDAEDMDEMPEELM